MSFQDEYKITSADRLDKGVYGLPDTPGMTTAAIQERFDSLGNLAIDKFNALVEAASDVVDGSDTKFPTNKAVEDYISGEGGAIIDDTTPSLHKAYSSQKVENMFGDVASRVIDDTEPLSNKTYSSEEIEEKLSNIPSPESIIDDDTASTATTYSSSKLESDFISVSDTEEQTATDEFTTINGGLLSECKVALSPNQDLHGYDSPWVGGAGKNKFEVTATTATEQGVLFNVNSDGTITTTRQSASSNNASIILGDFTLPVGSYKINGANNAGTGGYFTLRKASDNTFIANIESSGYDLNVTDATFEYRLTCVVQSAVSPTGDYTTVKPMIRLATETDPTFAPYSNICPISGHTQVEVEVGTNKLNPDNIVQGSLTTSAVSTRCSTRGNLTIPISVGQTITVSRQSSTINFALAVTDSSMSVLFDSGWQSGSYTYVSAYDGYVELVFAKQDGTDITPSIVKSANFMVEFGSTPSPYVPYTKGTYSLTVNLGGTYYSGTLDVVSGVLTVDKKSVEYDGSNDENWIKVSGEYRYYIEKSSDINANPDGSTSNEFKYSGTSGASVPDGQFYVGGTNLGVRLNTITSVADWKTFLSNKPFMVVYPLATPFTIQLIPTPVKANVGENHLSAPLDGQEITESVYSPLAKWNAVIDDTTASDDTTYSSNKINTIVPKIDDNTTSASKVFSSLKTANLITELSERFDFSTTEKPLGWWTDGKVYYGKVINIMGCPKEMFGLMVDLGVEVDTFIGLFAVGDAQDDNYNGGYCMGGTIYCKVTKSEGQNTQIQPACAVMALSRASLLVLYTKVE